VVPVVVVINVDIDKVCCRRFFCDEPDFVDDSGCGKKQLDEVAPCLFGDVDGLCGCDCKVVVGIRRVNPDGWIA